MGKKRITFSFRHICLAARGTAAENYCHLTLVDISLLAAACFLFPVSDNLQISGAWRTKLDSLSHNNHFRVLLFFAAKRPRRLGLRKEGEDEACWPILSVLLIKKCVCTSLKNSHVAAAPSHFAGFLPQCPLPT